MCNKSMSEKAEEDLFLQCIKRGYKVLGKYINSNTKIKLLCPKGHEWDVTPSKFRNGRECSKCTGRCPKEVKKNFFELCKERGYKIIGDYVNSNIKVKLLCPKGHEWDVMPTIFKLGVNCRKCMGNCPEEGKKELLKLCEERGYKIIGDYVNSNVKVKLLCSSGHEWDVTPSKFKNGRECSKCTGRCPEESKKNFFELCKKRGYKVIGDYVNSKTKVKLVCSAGHERNVIPDNLKTGMNCRKCMQKKYFEKAKKDFLEVCNKRGYKVIGNYVNSNTKVKLLCPKGHEWDVVPSKFRSGRECSKCTGWCPTEVKQLFFELCNKRRYKVIGNYVNSNTKVKLLCPKGHEWDVRPTSFKLGANCRKCVGHCPEESEKDFLKLCKERGYTVLGKYVKSSEKVKLLCPKGHEWGVTPSDFKLGTNCRICAGRCSETAKKEFMNLCEKRGYKVIGQYINTSTKVKVICPFGHEWDVIPGNFKTGANCRKCDGHCPEEAEKKWKTFMMYYKYTPLTEYVDSKTKVLIRCNWCDKEFWTIPGRRYNNIRGCPRCNNSDSETTRESFYQKLLLNNITPIELYINTHTKILVKHNSCGTEWYMVPGKFLYENRNKCPVCRKRARSGRENNRTSVLKIIKKSGDKK